MLPDRSSAGRLPLTPFGRARLACAVAGARDRPLRQRRGARLGGVSSKRHRRRLGFRSGNLSFRTIQIYYSSIIASCKILDCYFVQNIIITV